MAKSTITPFVIKYYKNDGNVALDVSYAGCITLWQSVCRVLSLDGVIAKVVQLPDVYAGDYYDREDLSQFLYQQMTEYFKKI
jgi:hypothetical protein